LSHLRTRHVYPEYVTHEVRCQITREIQREECELYSVYLSLFMHSQVTERSCYSMVHGLNLSCETYHSAICSLTSTSQILYGIESLGFDHHRRVHHRRLQCYLDQEAEERRILYLGTDIRELRGIYDDIKKNTERDLENYSQQLASEIDQLKESHLSLTRDYLKIGSEYQHEIDTLRQEYEAQRGEDDKAIAQQRKTMKEGILRPQGGNQYSLQRSEDEEGLSSNEEYLRQLLQISQSCCGDDKARHGMPPQDLPLLPDLLREVPPDQRPGGRPDSVEKP
jgi:hypothetical protein